MWSGTRDSNPRPPAWEASALPTELVPRKRMMSTPKPPILSTVMWLPGDHAATRHGVTPRQAQSNSLRVTAARFCSPARSRSHSA